MHEDVAEATTPSTTPAPDPLTTPRLFGYNAPMTKSCTPGFFPIDNDPPPPTTRATKPDTIVLRGASISLTSDVGAAFVADCARNREKIFSDSELREKYQIDDKAWTEIIANKALRLAVSIECQRRILNNDASREGAARQFTKAPAVLGKILENEQISPRSRIAAAQELRASAATGADRPSNEVDRIHIVINLGADERVVVDAPANPTPPRGISDGEDDPW